MKKTQIKEILMDAINSFEDIENYELIGLIGSMTKEGGNFGDVDLVSIGKPETHRKFKEYLTKKFQEKGMKIVFLKTILKESEINKGLVILHDLYYKNKEELLEKEWPTVTNTIIEDCLILRGQNLIKNEHLREITKENFLGPLFNWAKGIKDNRGYDVFEGHLLNISSIFERYGFVKELKDIKKVINSDENWKEKLMQIKEVLS
ncbi:MAG: hypothetical protein Q8N63_05430 [Nanoarchaeota archaeon]|nr:hypothetical protein [Nanoarchaeota archaeon]